MKFDYPAIRNPIDRLKVVGRPTARIEGRLKTTGTAPYAYEQHAAAPGAVYGYIVGAASSTAGVYAACMKLREMVASRLGYVATDIQFTGGRVRAGGLSRPLTDAVGQAS